MLTAALFFLLAFATMATLVWCGHGAAQEAGEPARRPAGGTAVERHGGRPRARPRRRTGGGFVNRVLYLVSIIPGGEDWIEGHEKELNQAGMRNQQALALYALFNLLSCWR